MNMTVHRTPASAVAAPFVLAELKDHLRIEDDASDFEIQRIARAAAAEMEQFAQVALLTQTVTLTAFDPPPDAYLRLPVGPVAQDHTPAVTMDGAAFTDFMFVAGIRPVIRWGATWRTQAPLVLEVEYTAGFGPQASDIPADLAQAIRDQAALHYDGRSPMDAKALTISPHMARIGARYRGVQA